MDWRKEQNSWWLDIIDYSDSIYSDTRDDGIWTVSQVPGIEIVLQNAIQ